MSENSKVEGKITHLFPGKALGTVEIAPDGKSLIYSPPPGFVGTERFRYVIDSHFEAEVHVHMHQVAYHQNYNLETDSFDNEFPILAKNSSLFASSFGRGHPLYGDGLELERITSVGATSQGGSVTISADGQQVLYTPKPGFVGQEEFVYTMDDEFTSTVSINVTRYVRDDLIQVFQDVAGQRLNVLHNDFLGNGYTGLREITSVSSATSGAEVTIDSELNQLIYSPPSEFTGTDRFTYVVDGEFIATVRLDVVPPVRADVFEFCPDPIPDGLALPVLDNDRFHASYTGPLVITEAIVIDGGGRVEINSDGKGLSYFPAENTFDGKIQYTVDGRYKTTASLHVTSVTRPDRFTVDQNSDDAVLDVMVNDNRIFYWDHPCRDFGQRHPISERVITAAGPTQQGGVVTIADDGQTVLYSPPEDFVGIDSFTYTVDGIMSGTVSVEVIRRLRDDVYRVDPGSVSNILPVQVNDLFHADYIGERRITNITDSTVGATISIAEDGKSIHYIPPVGFTGEETFTYTVDNRLKATVRIFVQASRENAYPRFESRDALAGYLLEEGLKQFEGLFGEPVSIGGWGMPFGGDHEGNNLGSEIFIGLADQPTSSETNVQTAGVDEGDLIETDGKYLYVLRGDELIITRARPADNMQIVSRVEVPGVPIGEYLKGDRLTVISKDRQPKIFPANSDDGFPARFGNAKARFGNAKNHVRVTVYDVSNQEHPRIVQTTALEGEYYDSRGVGDHVFVIFKDGFPQPPKPPINHQELLGEVNLHPDGVGFTSFEHLPTQFSPDDIKIISCVVDFCGPSWPVPRVHQSYYSREQYIEWFYENQDEILENAMPKFRSFDQQGGLSQIGDLVSPEDLPIPLDTDGNLLPMNNHLLMVTSIDVTADTPAPPTTSTITATNLQAIYGTLDNLYVFTNEWATSEASTTRIRKFAWNGETGHVTYVSQGAVPGKMLNQFSADEHEGSLRVGTTIQYGRDRNLENAMFVLRDDLGVLEQVGSLQNLGVKQSIQSIRYIGSRAFVTTFSKTDPLYSIDLSDPSQPQAEGYVALPGYSSYMQFIDANHILAVGRNGPAGSIGPLQVSLFDVTDMATPVRVAEVTMERFSLSMAESDHHAFGYFAEHDMLTMPLFEAHYVRVDTDGDGYSETNQRVEENSLLAFHVDTGTENDDALLELRGTIPHEGRVRRSAYIGDVLYSIGDDAIHSVDITAPDNVLDSVSFLEIPLDTNPQRVRRDAKTLIPRITALKDTAVGAAHGSELLERRGVLRRRAGRIKPATLSDTADRGADENAADPTSLIRANRTTRSSLRSHRTRVAKIVPHIADAVLADLM